MKIILLKDIAKVGRRYEVKEISDGYAANHLIPRGLALAATAGALKSLEVEKAKADAERKIHDDLLSKNVMELDGKTIVIKTKGNEKGHLFAGLHKTELISEIQEQTRLRLNEEHIILDKPIKIAGEHTIEVKGAGKSAKFTLKIEAVK